MSHITPLISACAPVETTFLDREGGMFDTKSIWWLIVVVSWCEVKDTTFSFTTRVWRSYQINRLNWRMKFEVRIGQDGLLGGC
jgi:hypothetical protein